jgi:signal transduction histidine kinase
LALWAALVVVVMTLAVVAATAGVAYAVDGRVPIVGVVCGVAVGALLATFAAWSTHRIDISVRRLLRPSKDAGNASSPRPSRLWSLVVRLTDLQRLATAVSALQLRARVAEEVAEQAERTSHTATAGMYELLSGLVAAEEATRGQLSADLHDTVAQSLASARVMLAAPDGQPGAWEQVRELVDDAEEQLRAAMSRARPPELRDGDLASAVSALRHELASRYLLTVRLQWPEQPRPLPLVSAVTLYRFFQEALLNVVKHADVDEAVASLEIDGDTVIATVRDEGPGFSPSQVRSTGGRHIGLGLLRERARLAGGRIEVSSEPGRGTTLELRLPIRPRIPVADRRVDSVTAAGLAPEVARTASSTR